MTAIKKDESQRMDDGKEMISGKKIGSNVSKIQGEKNEDRHGSKVVGFHDWGGAPP